MKIAVIVARILLGLTFTVAGLSGFVLSFGAGPPPMPGLAGQFQNVIFHSHYVLFIDGVQLITGLALLLNRYVALALLTSAAILFNILAFHLAMMPAGIVPGLVLTGCWFLIALQLRDRLKPLTT
jgi:putative oxidoreductase